MAARRATEIHKALTSKGMAPYESHHHMLRKEIPGVGPLITRLSHSGGEVGDGLAKRMANQLCLQLREFWELVDCTLSEEDWIKIARERCADGRNPFFGR